ncbi:unnamed protein product [Ceratitis capitata]|uniref:(Mediterranean fruit fly) hypothetical protein n=1 Tax=Ceratitis capitata TaxID=7213 RepID=A0A811U257_CERCA|nr:unnamed protein product [Ceratitis capitata]
MLSVAITIVQLLTSALLLLICLVSTTQFTVPLFHVGNNKYIRQNHVKNTTTTITKKPQNNMQQQQELKCHASAYYILMDLLQTTVLTTIVRLLTALYDAYYANPFVQRQQQSAMWHAMLHMI